MYEELDAHSLAGVWRHVHDLVDPRLGIKQLVEDRLQNIAVTIGDVGVLPIEVDADIGGAVPMPETQCASASRHRELLVK